jgi:hypothetical protein
MEKFRILMGYVAKQKTVTTNIFKDLKDIDLSDHDKRYVFALKAQQLYTALEDMLKSIAGNFENSVHDLSRYHLESLGILAVEVPGIRPSIISEQSLMILDKLRAFRHFIRHGYNYVLEEDELVLLQKKLNSSYGYILEDIDKFMIFLNQLCNEE